MSNTISETPEEQRLRFHRLIKTMVDIASSLRARRRALNGRVSVWRISVRWRNSSSVS